CFELRSNFKFKVIIGDGNDIDDLKKAIKEEQKPCFDIFAPSALTLWRVNASQITSEILNEELEDAAQKIGEAFHDVQGNNVRVVVRTPNTEELRAELAAFRVKHSYKLDYSKCTILSISDHPTIDISFTPVEELDLLVPLSETKFKQLKREKEYKETVNLGLKANPPLTSAKPSNFFSNQQENPILNGRPLEHTDLVVLSDIIEWVVDIISAETDRYTIKDERCKSDGILTTKVGIHNAIMEIFEGKNEVGSDGTDPSIQEAIYYRDYWSQSSFCIFGGVFLNRIVVQPLTDSIILTIDLQNKDQGLDLNQTGQRYFPYLRTLGGYKMIIMEYFSTSLNKKFDKIEILHQNSIYDDIKFAINLLYENNYVFADLRPPNILVYNQHETQRAILIDFDWCGRYGIDKYPPSLNMLIQ
ncbi:5670_t:CDS:2, partial [Funneliformis geosporum]